MENGGHGEEEGRRREGGEEGGAAVEGVLARAGSRVAQLQAECAN